MARSGKWEVSPKNWWEVGGLVQRWLPVGLVEGGRLIPLSHTPLVHFAAFIRSRVSDFPQVGVSTRSLTRIFFEITSKN